jgi:molybdopterin molybdotransferase
VKPDKSSLLSVADALAIVLRQAKPLAAEKMLLGSAARNLVLAETIVSDIDSPPYTKALMDGYAVQTLAGAAGSQATPVQTLAYAAGSQATLRVIEEIAAGKMPSRHVGPGEAARIMTGAPVPDGADAVVPIEKTEAASAGEVRLLVTPKPGQNILQRGTEMKAGEMILQPGIALGPQEFGILASVGRTGAMVHPRLRVGILSTGDEIVEPSQFPGPGQIRNSNSPMLAAQVERAGGTSEIIGIARDTVASLRTMIGTGFADHDVLILSGGVSAGKFDLVPGVLRELGVVAHFHKIALKPGKPLFFGTRGDKLVFGLPGNPVSSFVCFELFIRPALMKLMGHSDCGPRQTRMPLAADFQTDNDRPTYWPARIEWSEDGSRVRALPWFGSADLRALHTANALLVLPPGAQSFLAGATVGVILLSE